MTDTIWYRDRERLLAEVEKHGSPTAAARANNTAARTVTTWYNKLVGPSPAPRAGGKRLENPVPLDDPDRVERERKDAEIRYLRGENTALLKQRANREAVIQRIVDAASVPVKVPSFKVRAKSRAKKPQRACVMPLYDLQYGQFVRESDVPLGMGEFSTAIFDQRLARYVKATTETIRDYAASHDVTELMFVLGGDLVEGADIFRGQAWQLEKDPAVQTHELTHKLSEALIQLTGFAREELGCERIGVVAVPGNHGKVGGKQAGATPATMSWDWLSCEWIRDKLAPLELDLFAVEPAGAVLFEVADHVFLAIHGDEVKGWGGLPFYGLTRYDGRAMRMANLVYDYCLLGHHHQPASIPNGSGGEFIVSGDWVGGNNLSKFLTAASRPQQRILFVAKKYGVTENVPIYFERSRHGATAEVLTLS